MSEVFGTRYDEGGAKKGLQLQTAKSIMEIPVASGSELGDREIFVRNYANLSDEAWKAKLMESAATPEIDGIYFPRYPDQETQRRIHGSNTLENSMGGAFSFYRFVKSQIAPAEMGSGMFKLLDFGAGWGRINRPFLKDLPFNNIYAYEPNLAFCVLARKLNPYVTFINGDFMPDGVLPARYFDLIMGWSIFSHLSEQCAKAWLQEFARILKPGGRCVITTWGARFLKRLHVENEKLARGEPVDWYSKVCIEAAKNRIAERASEYDNGKFVWFTSGGSKLYGEAFLPEPALQRWLTELGLAFEIIQFDTTTLAQDGFILRARP